MKFRSFSYSVFDSFFLCFTSHYVASADEKHSAIKPEPRSGGWIKDMSHLMKGVAKGNVDLLLIGDSITHGWEGKGKKIWEQYYTKRNAVNLGIGGDRTQHVIWRLDNGNIKGISPKAAVVMIGTNNSGNNTPQEIADGLKVITEQLREKLPKTKVLLLGIFPRGENSKDKRRQVNEKANAIFKGFS